MKDGNYASMIDGDINQWERASSPYRNDHSVG
jgi:hypothetical protein